MKLRLDVEIEEASGRQGCHPGRERTHGLAAGLLHTAIIISGHGKAVAVVMVVVAVPAAVIEVAAGQLLPGVRRRWQWYAGAHGQRANRVCMSACKGGGDEKQMKQ